jgi:hypothetical protein
MAISYAAATRCAHAVAVLTLIVGFVLLGREAYRDRSVPTGSSDTTTKNTTERKTTAKGTDTTEKREVTSTPNPNFTERALGQGGLWLLRLFLVLLAAFFAGAAVQRALLGNFAFKAGAFEVPELPPPPLTQELSPLPGALVAAFQLDVSPTTTFPPQLGPGIVSSSYAMDLLDRIKGQGPADYAIIDLGSGRNWLTSRLFIFAILLKRMRSLKTFVFVETRDGIEKRFLGVMPPDAVHWLLAREYPWLEEAFAKAYCELPNLQIRSESGALESVTAGTVVEHFLHNENIQSTDPGRDDSWVQLASGRFEHARWINQSLLREVFDLSPLLTSVVDLGDLAASERTMAVLVCEGPFVAVVDETRRFKSLLDRQALLERLAIRLLSVYRSPVTNMTKADAGLGGLIVPKYVDEGAGVRENNGPRVPPT